MSEREFKVNKARSIMRHAYLCATIELRGVTEITAQDIANGDALDEMIWGYMADITTENVIDQTSPRTIMTRAMVEGMARAEAVRVTDHHDESLRKLVDDIRNTIAELGRHARDGMDRYTNPEAIAAIMRDPPPPPEAAPEGQGFAHSAFQGEGATPVAQPEKTP